YHSVFKGQGMTFAEVRDYQPGDDIRLIDWNVTARYGSPYVKIFEEERELTVYLLVDVSRSGLFGSRTRLKAEIGAEIAAVLGFSAIKNNDKVGVILFTDEVEKYIAPKKGRSHILRTVREILYYRGQRPGTSLDRALQFLLKVAKRRSVVFLLSDFIDTGYWDTLKMVNRKHDLIGLRLLDPTEREIPDLGLVRFHDPETGEADWIDTSSEGVRDAFRRQAELRDREFLSRAKRNHFDVISVTTTEDYIDPLMTFFKTREKRR
ncbi:MAG: DUF58 domain-containing protein, partial [Candidatus Neomarinimicrobiota bacterium]